MESLEETEVDLGCVATEDDVSSVQTVYTNLTPVTIQDANGLRQVDISNCGHRLHPKSKTADSLRKGKFQDSHTHVQSDVLSFVRFTCLLSKPTH